MRFFIDTANVDEIREAKKKGEKVPYDFVEFMACRGGCIAGGGQPIGTDDDVRKKRTDGLYADDEKCTLRRSHENPSIKKIYSEYLGAPLSHKAHELLHATFSAKPLYKD